MMLLVFPRLFASIKSLGIAYLPYEEEISPIGYDRNLTLNGSLCFLKSTNASEQTGLPLYG